MAPTPLAVSIPTHIHLGATYSSHKLNGSVALAKAISRYGISEIEHGFLFAVGGPGGVIMRKVAADNKCVGSGCAVEVPTLDAFGDLLEIIAVKVGTPGVDLQLNVDTGSADTWVLSSELKQSQAGLSQHALYDPAKSATAQKQTGKTWSIQYGDGSSASGNVFHDVLQIGKLKVTGQAVETAQQVSQSFLGPGSDGLLGLAFGNINTVKPTRSTTILESMIKRNLIELPVFTANLPKGPDGGFYTFGSIDPSVTSAPINYTPVDDSQGFWSVESPSWILNGEVQTRTLGQTAIIDTGTTLMLVDDDVVQMIYDSIPGSRIDMLSGGYIFPADAQLPQLSFAIGNQFISLDKATLMYGEPDQDGNVFGAIQSSGNSGFCIMGGTFFHNAYVVFDLGNLQIGVAQRNA